jgi:hypothetical protein
MTFLAPLLAAATFVTGSATFVPPADQGTSSSQGSSSSTKRGGSAQPHDMGLGATFGLGVTGSGAMIRFFFNDWIGVDTRVLMGSRPNSSGHSQGFSLQFAPSAIVMLKPPSTSSNVDIRPYVGGGISLTHTWADAPLGLPAAGGMGEQVFGGVEIQIRAADSFAISLEVIHYFQADALKGTMAPSGTSFVVGVSLYK